MKPELFAHKLYELYGNDLHSVIQYGSPSNIVVVLDDITPSALFKANRLIRKWTGCRHSPPLFFTPEHFVTSADVFPIEFFDIRSKHTVLAGKNVIDGIVIHKDNLRHECESELRGKLLYLRQYFSMHAHRPRRIMRVMQESFPTILSVFRGVLHLMGEKPGVTADTICNELCRRTETNPNSFTELIAWRDKKMSPPRGKEALAAFERYLTALGSITKYVDSLPITKG